MKMMQQETIFAPIAIVFETADEAEDFWQLIREAARGQKLTDKSMDKALRISNWFSNEAKL